MTRRDAQIAAAVFAGTLVRITRRALRKALRMAPGLASAAAVAVGLGEVAGQVWGAGLTWRVSLLAGGVLGLWFAAELNRVPAPRRDDDG